MNQYDKTAERLCLAVFSILLIVMFFDLRHRSHKMSCPKFPDNCNILTCQELERDLGTPAPNFAEIIEQIKIRENITEVDYTFFNDSLVQVPTVLRKHDLLDSMIHSTTMAFSIKEMFLSIFTSESYIAEYRRKMGLPPLE